MTEYDATKMPPIHGWHRPHNEGGPETPSVRFESREHYDAVRERLDFGIDVDSKTLARRGRINKIAKACHEVNRTYCSALGDGSQLPWDDAPEWQRESARNGVTAILDGTVTTPEDSHKNWMAEKEAQGWKYGPKKDPDKKEHPCMILYAALPAEQKAKDALFHATVAGMAPR